LIDLIGSIDSIDSIDLIDAKGLAVCPKQHCVANKPKQHRIFADVLVAPNRTNRINRINRINI